MFFIKHSRKMLNNDIILFCRYKKPCSDIFLYLIKNLIYSIHFKTKGDLKTDFSQSGNMNNE